MVTNLHLATGINTIMFISFRQFVWFTVTMFMSEFWAIGSNTRIYTDRKNNSIYIIQTHLQTFLNLIFQIIPRVLVESLEYRRTEKMRLLSAMTIRRN